MNVIVFFEEMLKYVWRYYFIRLQLKCVDDKTIEVRYCPGTFIPPVTLTLHIDAMRNNVVYMSYKCSTAVNMLILGALRHIGNNLPKCVEIDASERRINIYIERIDELKPILNYAQPEEMRFNMDGVELDVSLI